MDTAIDESTALKKQQAIENLYNELHKIYLNIVGKEPDPEIVWAEAEDLVAKYGPNLELNDLF
jgi:hypothetical protein